MNYYLLSVPGFTPSSLTLVNKTITTITVSWTSNSSDADGYVVNVTSDTDTVLRTQQVEGGNQSAVTLEGLRGGTTYSITVRAYQQLLGPASSAISAQTLPGIAVNVHLLLLTLIMCISSYFINQLDTSLIHYRTQ